jgi:hypothetical protein
VFGWVEREMMESGEGKGRRKFSFFGWDEKVEEKKWGGWSFPLGFTNFFPFKLIRKWGGKWHLEEHYKITERVSKY